MKMMVRGAAPFRRVAISAAASAATPVHAPRWASTSATAKVRLPDGFVPPAEFPKLEWPHGAEPYESSSEGLFPFLGVRGRLAVLGVLAASMVALLHSRSSKPRPVTLAQLRAADGGLFARAVEKVYVVADELGDQCPMRDVLFPGGERASATPTRDGEWWDSELVSFNTAVRPLFLLVRDMQLLSLIDELADPKTGEVVGYMHVRVRNSTEGPVLLSATISNADGDRSWSLPLSHAALNAGTHFSLIPLAYD
jgi:hypothetical protein